MATATSKRREAAVRKTLAAAEQIVAPASVVPETAAEEPLPVVIELSSGARVSTVTGELLAEPDGSIPSPAPVPPKEPAAAGPAQATEKLPPGIRFVEDRTCPECGQAVVKTKRAGTWYHVCRDALSPEPNCWWSEMAP